MSRIVDIASFCGPWSADLLLHTLEETAAGGADLIVLPETWQGEMVMPDAPLHRQISEIAGRHHVYIAQSTFLNDEGKRYNSILLYDREGMQAARYDKAYPYWSEFELTPPAQPGIRPNTTTCDFGVLGMAVCFDANFPQLWQAMADRGAELVIWPSAYAAGDQLKAHALNCHYPIVTSTTSGHFLVFDIDGSRIADTYGGTRVERVKLDLDRCIFHENFNMKQCDALLKEDPRRVDLEKRLLQEQWFIMRAAKPEESARKVCACAGMEELRAYKRRSLSAIDALRNIKA